jgi:hypothetical protein
MPLYWSACHRFFSLISSNPSALTVRAGCFHAVHRRADDLVGLVAKVGARLGGIDDALVADVLGHLLLPEACGLRPVTRFPAARCLRAGLHIRCAGGLAGAVGRVGIGIDGHCSPPAAVGAW